MPSRGKLRQPRSRSNKKAVEQKKKEVESEEKERKEASIAKFQFHKKEAQESIQKLLEELSEEESEEDEVIEAEERLKHLQNSFTQDEVAEMETFCRNTNSTCVVCLEKVRNKDSIWQCERCSCMLHLPCTQNWAKSCYCEATQGNEDPNGTWQCPKCRMLYLKKDIPRKYLCYCGKVENPPVDHWILPHSCGDICHKALKPECGHFCLSRCHPGVCPPCPQTVDAPCYCGANHTLRRCNDRNYSCNNTCNKLLACKEHPCPEICHEGECPPCPKTRKAQCQCGGSLSLIKCAAGDFHCEEVCGKPLSCGNHRCEIVCHNGPCKSCPLEGERPCHCGKTFVDHLDCTEPTPSCGGTCGNELHCYGKHLCNRRCHGGECTECRILVTKKCRCGRSKKSVQCFQEYLCKKACNKDRDCSWHACKKKCCTGDCPPCNEVCNRRLRCGNHKCEAICHPGVCFPCPKTVDVTCFCNSSVITVPCGLEKKTKAPKCKKKCKIPPTCHHPQRTPHPCHFGPCPPCNQICDVGKVGCKHPCSLVCHDPIPAWPTSAKVLKKFDPMRQKPTLLHQVRCPPCEVPLKRQCYGLHAKYEAACHSERTFDCKRPCGNPLECGNHTCEQPCHIVTDPRDLRVYMPDENDEAPNAFGETFSKQIPAHHGATLLVTGQVTLGDMIKYVSEKWDDTCATCSLLCQKKRNPFCKHPCQLPCHPETCPPCETLIRKYCHCPLNTLTVLKCHQTHVPKEKMDAVRSCGTDCTKKLACGHICKLICHAGPCRKVEECVGRVRLYCACKRKKESFPCPSAPKKVPCDDLCEEYKKEKEKKALEVKAKQKEAKEREAEERALSTSTKKSRKIRKPKVILEKKKPNALVVWFSSTYTTLTSADLWKTIFVYTLPFWFLFIFVLLAFSK